MNKFRPFFPDLLMVAIMVTVSLLYMSPVFEGKTLPQGDVIHAQDQIADVLEFQDETGEYPGWTNSAFSGMPTYQLKSPPSKNIFHYLLRFFKLYLPGYTVAILFVALLGFYFLLRTLKLNHWLALAGALAFGLSSHHIQLIGTGHVSKIYAAAYMAPVIAGMFMVFKKKYLGGGLLTAFGLGIQISTNHVQVTYYLGIMVVLYLLVELVYALKEKYFSHFTKASMVLFIALILAILPNMTMLLTTYEYSKETTRGKTALVDENNKGDGGLDLEYMTQWSYGVGETLNLFIPNLYGGGSGTSFGDNSETLRALKKLNMPQAQAERINSGVGYWGNQPFTGGPHYLGAITIFLAILGLLLIRGPKKWWLIIVILLSIMLAWGNNFMWFTEFFAKNIPLYNKFRDVTNALLIAQFATPLLAFLGIRAWISDEKRDEKEKLKKLYIATGIAGGIAALVILIPGALFSFVSWQDAGNLSNGFPVDAFQADRLTIARKDAFRTLVFVLIGAGILWSSLKTKIKPVHLYGALALFILIDLWVVDKRYLNNDRFVSSRQLEQMSKILPADQAIHADQDLGYRVLDITSAAQDPFRYSRPSRYHRSVGGYHGAKLGRYQDLVDRYLFAEAAQMLAARNNPKATQESVMNAIDSLRIHNMLNTGYLIYSLQAAPFPVKGALGSAWFASEIKQVSSANEEISAIGEVDLGFVAIVNDEFQEQIAGLGVSTPTSTPDNISLTERLPNYLSYDAKANDKRLIVFSEIWYPHGWKAFVDGEETEILRANYLLRAIVVPAGEHQIEFRFKSDSLRIGQAVALIGSILVILLLLGYVYFTYARQNLSADNEKK